MQCLVREGEFYISVSICLMKYCAHLWNEYGARKSLVRVAALVRLVHAF